MGSAWDAGDIGGGHAHPQGCRDGMGAGRHRDGSLPNPPLASLGCELLSHEGFAAGFLLLDFAP